MLIPLVFGTMTKASGQLEYNNSMDMAPLYSQYSSCRSLNKPNFCGGGVKGTGWGEVN